MFSKILTAVVAVVLIGSGSVNAAENSPEVKRLLKRADQLKQDKKIDQSLDVLDKVLAIDPDNADAWAEVAWIYNEKGKFELAAKAANKALTTDPDHSNAWREGGYALLKLGKTEDAALALAISIDKNSKNFASYDYLVMALEMLGKNDLAQVIRKKKKDAQDD